MPEPLVSIIIVNYNGQKWLKKCLDSIFSQTYPKIEVVLVDNASSDQSCEFIKQKYPQVRLIKSASNLGFAGGNNLGIKSAKGTHLLLLNSDTWIEKDFLAQLVVFYQSHDYDVVSALESEYEQLKIHRKDFSTQIDLLGYPIVLPLTKKENYFNLCGFCLFFKKDFYLKTQGLDDNFFMYLEEIDWFWRLKLLKKKIGLAKHLVVYHASGGSVGGQGLQYRIFLWRNQNLLQMLLKNYASQSLFWVLPLYFLQNIFEMLIFVILLKPRLAFSYVQGWCFNFKNRQKIWEKRKWVQQHRLLSEKEFFRDNVYWGIGKIYHLKQYLTEKYGK